MQLLRLSVEHHARREVIRGKHKAVPYHTPFLFSTDLIGRPLLVPNAEIELKIFVVVDVGGAHRHLGTCFLRAGIRRRLGRETDRNDGLGLPCYWPLPSVTRLRIPILRHGPIAGRETGVLKKTVEDRQGSPGLLAGLLGVSRSLEQTYELRSPVRTPIQRSESDGILTRAPCTKPTSTHSAT